MENQNQPKQPYSIQPTTSNNPSTLKWMLIVLVVIVISVVFFGFGTYYLSQQKLQSITDFDSCAKAGYPVAMSYPATCRTADGRVFVQQLSEERGKTLQPPPRTSPTPIWKSYTNKEYRFSFQYPSYFGEPLLDDSKHRFFPSQMISLQFAGIGEKYLGEILVRVYTDRQELVVQQYKKQVLATQAIDDVKKISAMNIRTMNGYEGVKLEYAYNAGSSQRPRIERIAIVILNNNKYTYSLQVNADTIDQILQTFKFTDN